jgi:hypothetical protein
MLSEVQKGRWACPQGKGIPFVFRQFVLLVAYTKTDLSLAPTDQDRWLTIDVSDPELCCHLESQSGYRKPKKAKTASTMTTKPTR